MKTLALCVLLFLTVVNVPTRLTGQTQPSGDPAEIKSAIMSSNNITAVVYNYGQLSRPNTLSGVADFVWRGLGHMFEFGPLLAGEVIGTNGDTMRILDDGMWLPSQGGYSPDGTEKWGWLPRAGYARPGQQSLATSNNPSSWPASWTAWPGEYGDGVVTGLNEAFYAMDDFTNRKYPYFPFPSDTSRRGLGVSAEVRVYQFGGNLADALIIKWKLKNESPQNIIRCYFGFYGDPHIGGANDFSDDLVYFVDRNGPAGDPSRYWARNTIYEWDWDGVGMNGRPTGYLSFKFLKTPGENDLTTLYALPYTNSVPNVPKNDVYFWQLLSADSIDYNQELFTNPSDNIVVFGSGPFSLMAGESTFVSLAIFLSENYEDMLDDASLIHFASHWPDISSVEGQSGGDLAYSVSLVSPNGGIISGEVPITWNYTGSDPGAKVLIEYSSNRGVSWRALTWDHPVSQPYTWNTSGVRDGVNYLLRMVAHNADLSRYYYDLTDQRFTINNPANAQPELALNLPFEGTTVRTSPLPISWVSEDADNATLEVAVSYSLNPAGPFTQIVSNSYANGSHTYNWNFSQVPNASTYYLRVTASDGNSDTTLVSGSFAIDQEAGHYLSGAFQQVAGKGTPDFLLQVVDPAQLTGHTYELTFTVPHPDSTKFITVRDILTGFNVVSDYPISPGVSTPLFDGLKLGVTDTPADVNPAKSGFNRAALDSAVDFTWGGLYFNRVKVPLDWYIAFHPLDTLPNGWYGFPGDTLLNQFGQPRVVCPFELVNVDSIQPGKGLVRDLSPRNDRWDLVESIFLRPQDAVGNQISYQVNFDFATGNLPGAGDTLWIITDKPVTSADVFRFVADTNYITGVQTATIVQGYELSNNYPNPFNPVTSLEYRISKSELVSLKVYDVLGREVATLVNEMKPAGLHRVQFNASSLASGIYFYRLQAGSFVAVKRMLLLK